jgi:uncharacterized protein (DUF58 family)
MKAELPSKAALPSKAELPVKPAQRHSYSAWPILTPRALVLFSFSALLTLWFSAAWYALTAFVAVALACLLDFVLSRKSQAFSVERRMDAIGVLGKTLQVDVLISSAPLGRPFEGSFRDVVTSGFVDAPPVMRLQSATVAQHSYSIHPTSRGAIRFTGVALRVVGRFGLVLCDCFVENESVVDVFPNLAALSKEAVAKAVLLPHSPGARTRYQHSGSEFDTLRPYTPNDSFRTIDWKSSARRATPVVRIRQPEQNQSVYLFIDCGRHMAASVGTKRKLDVAIDAALQLAAVALHRGDQVGVVTSQADTSSVMLARRGTGHLKSIARMLQPLEASHRDSALPLAVSRLLAVNQKRSLVLLFSQVDDQSSTERLMSESRRLGRKHLPLVICMLDPSLLQLVTTPPRDTRAATAHVLASHLLSNAERLALLLKESGSRVIRAAPDELSSASVSAYLQVKATGAL